MSHHPVNVDLTKQTGAIHQLLKNEAHQNPGLASLVGKEATLATQLLALVANGEGYINGRNFDKEPIANAPELTLLLSKEHPHQESIKETIAILAKGLSTELTKTAPHTPPQYIVGSTMGLGNLGRPNLSLGRND